MQRPEVSFDPNEQRAARVVLIGFMGAGKTTLAGEWAATGLPVLWFDSDRATLHRLGVETVTEAFAVHGEAAFRAAEHDVILERAAPLDHGLELWSLGGGAVLDPDVQRLLFDAVVVWLDADPALLWQRVCESDDDRPLATDRDAFLERYEQRRPIYEALATVRLATDEEVDPMAVAQVLGDHLSPEVFSAGLAVGIGVLDRLDELTATQEATVAIVADRAVDATADRVRAQLEGAGANIVADDRLAMGEWNKQLGTVELLLRRWSAAGLHRAGVVVAIGGGTTLDVAGFAASIYQRGVRWVSVPTTVTAQVDAGIGGKTGVNLGVVKNVVGTVHFPSTTCIDARVLASLPPHEVRAGLVEAIKTGLLAGPWLLDQVRALVGAGGDALDASPRATAWQPVVAGCSAYKAAVVEEDVEDTDGVRAQLNLGHTLGHAIEAASGGAIGHGAAVAIGVHAALRLSVVVLDSDPQLVADYRELCDAAGIEVTSPLAWSDIEPFLMHDKKRTDEGIGWVLLEAAGSPVTEVPIELAVVQTVWEQAIQQAGNAARAVGRPRPPRVLVLFGVNLGELGRRDSAHYGSQTLPTLIADIEQWAAERGLVADCRQTDSLERFLGALHEAHTAHAAVIVNPGAWTHHERALHDALESLPVPRVEIHLSDVDAREEWRSESVISPVVDHRISGTGSSGYAQALDWVAAQLGLATPGTAGAGGDADSRIGT